MKQETIKVLALGDIIGEPGRKAVISNIKKIRSELNIDFAIANGENSAGGFGINKKIASTLLSSGIDVITTGNHIWKQKDIRDFFKSNNNILRAANYPAVTCGKGSYIYNVNDVSIGVINILGRIFMEPIDCPFICIQKEIELIADKTNIIIVDFHAETTSEKIAMGWHLDGKVSLVFGTHTHVQTADERILPNGTAYITDIGMSGPKDSVIGMNKENIIQKFITGLPQKLEVAKENVQIDGIVTEISVKTGKAVSIDRFQRKIT
jgi:hypothetical protein